MTFVDSIKTCFGKYVTFSGRASRSEYWWFVLFVILGSILVGIVDGTLFGPIETFSEVVVTDPAGSRSEEAYSSTTYGNGWLGTIFSIVTVVPTLAVTWRRLHDRDMRGWWALLPYGLGLLAAVILSGVFAASSGIARPVGAPSDAALESAAVAPASIVLVLLFGMVLITIASAIWLIVTLARRGTPGPNRFGPPPPGTPPAPHSASAVRVGDVPHVGGKP